MLCRECFIPLMKSSLEMIRYFKFSFLLVLFQSVTFAQSEAIRLGATLPLSGDVSTYGNLIRDGIILASEDLNKKGIPIELFFEDVPTPGAQALSAINKLISQSKIEALAGNFWNPVIPIIAPELAKNKISSFHSAVADDLILNANDFVFSTNHKIKDEAYRLAEYAYNVLGAKTAGVLSISTTFGDHYQKHFISKFIELGGKVVVNDNTLLDQPDVKPALSKILLKKPDVFFAAYFGTNLGTVLKQAKQLNINSKILSVYEADDPSVLSVAGRAAEGLHFFVSEPKVITNKIIEYRERFKIRFGYKSRILADNAYDATMILAEAIQLCKSDKICIRDQIYKIKNYNGVSGTFSIDPDGATSKSFILKTVKNGEFVVEE